MITENEAMLNRMLSQLGWLSIDYTDISSEVADHVGTSFTRRMPFLAMLAGRLPQPGSFQWWRNREYGPAIGMATLGDDWFCIYKRFNEGMVVAVATPQGSANLLSVRDMIEVTLEHFPNSISDGYDPDDFEVF